MEESSVVMPDDWDLETPTELRHIFPLPPSRPKRELVLAENDRSIYVLALTHQAGIDAISGPGSRRTSWKGNSN